MYKYTAIIIEPRKHKALNFVLRNALECLSDEWKIVLFHGTRNKEYCRTILDSLSNKRLSMVDLGVDNLNSYTYSRVLATKSVVYDYIDTEYFLVFQTDSMLFKQYRGLINAFLTGEYDYVGSPWLRTGYEPTRRRGFIGNGGLSLRKTKTMLEIIEKGHWVDIDKNGVEWLEDLFFCGGGDVVQLNKPSYEMAMLFAVEEVFSEVSFGCHKVWCTAHFEKFRKIHPEVDELVKLQAEET